MIVWKDIEGFEGKYQISTEGTVLSVHTNKLMSLQLGGNGYYKVGLRNENGKERYSIHRLVAEHFISNPHNKPQINHIDGNPLNNNVDNLEWCTPSENALHAFKHGRRRAHYKNIGLKFGRSSRYHYVDRISNAVKGEIYFRAVVKATVQGKLFAKSKQFSIKKYGESEAERMAAQAANLIVQTYSEFNGYALNVI
jgi:hypothetical protein